MNFSMMHESTNIKTVDSVPPSLNHPVHDWMKSAQYIRFLNSWELNDKSLQCYVTFDYCSEVLSSFNTNLRHSVAIVPSV